MPDEQAHDETDHCEVVTAFEQRRDDSRERHADLDELVANELKRLQRADAGRWSDAGSAIPIPNMAVAYVCPPGAGDLELGPVCIDGDVVDGSTDLLQTRQGACPGECG